MIWRAAAPLRLRNRCTFFPCRDARSSWVRSFTGRWILRPIRRLIRSAEEIKQGNLELVIERDSRDEIGQLSEAFNEMALALRESRRSDQTRLTRMQRADRADL